MLDMSFSWRGMERPKPTDEEVVASSIKLAEEAALAFSVAKVEYDRRPAGDPKLRDLACDMARARSDQAHWREMAQWFRDRIAARAKTTDRRLPREPGEDDVEAA
ncbi:MAG TPA: hypothetical protein VFB66_22205 [Tepidisphaeraceae bacterium]|nr:hypothetical protein [Tepidisphaeraceae bacterium]